MADRIRLGISSCLLGNLVRYDGSHQHDQFLTETLGRYVDYLPVCPEVECGLGIPRESLRLVGSPASPRLMTSRSGIDHTERMCSWAGERLRELAREDLDGFIFKNGSPSSGMERVKVYSDEGMPRKAGTGIFARAFMDFFATLPVEEDGRLHDPGLRENFIERIFVHRRWRQLLADRPGIGDLVAFHTAHKLLILSHSEKIYRDMGRLVAQASSLVLEEVLDSYEQLLMAALKLQSTLNKHTNVLMHMLGYFKKQLSSDEKAELLEIIERFKMGFLPLIVPVTLINHFVRKYHEEYLAGQFYLNPHPLELKLRNHA
jgi:uncharacterized protein YbgA (DUF1722 family)/uncharacterized protein YbbK (DUF523 family)